MPTNGHPEHQKQQIDTEEAGLVAAFLFVLTQSGCSEYISLSFTPVVPEVASKTAQSAQPDEVETLWYREVPVKWPWSSDGENVTIYPSI